MSDTSPAQERLTAAWKTLATDWATLVAAACDCWKPGDATTRPGKGLFVDPETSCQPAHVDTGTVRVGVPVQAVRVQLAPVQVERVVAGAPVALAASQPATGPGSLEPGAGDVVINVPGAPRGMYLGEVATAAGQVLSPFVVYVDGLT